MHRIIASGLILLLCAANAYGDIYKCVSSDGVVKFSDEPCSEKATVVFPSADRPFDEVIGNASPYPDQPVESYHMDDEVLERHARKIGRTIIPGETIRSIKRTKIPMTPGWRATLYLGPEHDSERFVINLEYLVNQKPEGAYIWLNGFRVRKQGKPYDPPAMANTKKFKKIGTGNWEIR